MYNTLRKKATSTKKSYLLAGIQPKGKCSRDKTNTMALNSHPSLLSLNDEESHSFHYQHFTEHLTDFPNAHICGCRNQLLSKCK
jgi:hypothetical protein